MVENKTVRNSIVFLMVFFSIIGSDNLCASVVMSGTRIIYSSPLKAKTVQLSNRDDQPYIVQLQVARSDGQNITDDASAYFTLLPQIFRMEPGAGQSVRLIYSGETLPQDRETLFYLSFSQLPALKAQEKHTNQLIFAITNRIKIFFRPAGLSGTPDNIAEKLSFNLKEGNIEVSNPGGYYVVVRHAALVIKGRPVTLAKAMMISPKSTAIWQPSARINTLKGACLRLTLVNDYGSDVTTDRCL